MSVQRASCTVPPIVSRLLTLPPTATRKDAASVILEVQRSLAAIFFRCCGEAQCKSEAAGMLVRLNRFMANAEHQARVLPSPECSGSTIGGKP